MFLSRSIIILLFDLLEFYRFLAPLVDQVYIVKFRFVDNYYDVFCWTVNYVDEILGDVEEYVVGTEEWVEEAEKRLQHGRGIFDAVYIFTWNAQR